MICVRKRQAQSRLSFAQMLIGLTGGIGCGKSAAAAEFAALGFRAQDTDRIVKEEVLPDPAVVDLAVERWGRRVLYGVGEVGGGGERGSSHELDRVRVAEIVFSDANERRWWESVVHPRVGALWRRRVASAPEAEWVVEVPLLFEAGLEKGFDFVVCVGANPAIQLARAIARGMTPAQAGQRIASQLPLANKLHSAHAVLWNDGSRDFLRAQVATLVAALRA
jgi:dephospho-CoA kinase